MSRLRHGAFVGLVASLVALFATAAIALPHSRPAAAQESLSFEFTSSTTKAKVGDFVAFKVLIGNTGDTTIPAVSVLLGLPDALDARAVNCPGETHDTVTSCDLGDFAPGSLAEILFVVEVGAKSPNGPVTAFASSQFNTIAMAELPPLKIVGPNRS